MHDTHCHLDLYPDPYQVALATEQRHITTVAVTNLPSAYYAAKPHMRQFHHLKLAVGMHPLLAQNHTAKEKALFSQAFLETDYVGEVGLDFSRQGVSTQEQQIESLKFVLSLLQREHRYVTLHSRRAESIALDLLDDFRVCPVVFHWYSGPLKTLDTIVERGHYFSVNTAMIGTKGGQRIISRIPKERILTESDGPFIKIGSQPAMPHDVAMVSKYLAQCWNDSCDTVVNRLDANFDVYSKSVSVT